MFDMVKCPDCDGDNAMDPSVGNGKCSDCHGTGQNLDVLEDVADALSEEEQGCETCGGSGTCQTCKGDGYVEE